MADIFLAHICASRCGFFFACTNLVRFFLLAQNFSGAVSLKIVQANKKPHLRNRRDYRRVVCKSRWQCVWIASQVDRDITSAHPRRHTAALNTRIGHPAWRRAQCRTDFHLATFQTKQHYSPLAVLSRLYTTIASYFETITEQEAEELWDIIEECALKYNLWGVADENQFEDPAQVSKEIDR